MANRFLFVAVATAALLAPSIAAPAPKPNYWWVSLRMLRRTMLNIPDEHVGGMSLSGTPVAHLCSAPTSSTLQHQWTTRIPDSGPTALEKTRDPS